MTRGQFKVGLRRFSWFSIPAVTAATVLIRIYVLEDSTKGLDTDIFDGVTLGLIVFFIIRGFIWIYSYFIPESEVVPRVSGVAHNSVQARRGEGSHFQENSHLEDVQVRKQYSSFLAKIGIRIFGLIIPAGMWYAGLGLIGDHIIDLPEPINKILGGTIGIVLVVATVSGIAQFITGKPFLFKLIGIDEDTKKKEELEPPIKVKKLNIKPKKIETAERWVKNFWILVSLIILLPIAVFLISLLVR